MSLKPRRRKWLSAITRIGISRPGGVTFVVLSTIEDVAFLREVNHSWTTWAADNDQPDPLFNWISVFKFNAGPKTLAFTLSGFAAAEALMVAKVGHVVRCDAGHRQPLVYVNFLEVAPWNRQHVPSRLPALGPILLRLACDLSVQRGYRGRLGLHSVADAEDFYRRLGFRSLDCPSEYNELYFELDESGAKALLSD